jgi:catechol 2,3-dioxygenase-like lactoylglutathione lyase family enzyme
VVRAVVVDHVSIRVRDLEASRRFYETALAPLGFGVLYSDEGGAVSAFKARIKAPTPSGSLRAILLPPTAMSPSLPQTVTL